jgi:hypothetical protein
MGLLEQEINELRQLNRDFNAGKIKPENMMINLAIYSQTEKRAKMMLQVFSLVAKHKGKMLEKLTSSNIISGKQLLRISTEDPEHVEIKCKAKLKKGQEITTRQQCLDFSGDKKNAKYCNSCSTGKAVKKLLLQ